MSMVPPSMNPFTSSGGRGGGISGLSQFMAAVRQIESGGNYRAIGPRTRYGNATGAYQFLNSTWGGYGGYRRAADAPPRVQDQRAAQLMSQYYRQFGSWNLVAVAWHGGPGAARRAQRSGRISGGDVNISTQTYVNRVMGTMGRGGGGSINPFGGGRGGPGIQGASGGGSFIGDFGFQRPMTTAEAKDKAKELYGYLGWFVDHREVGPILINAAKEGWAPERLQGALLKTKWWQTTHEQARQWDALLQSDPATAKRRINETGLNIRAQVNKLGIRVGKNRLFALTVNALRHGWNEQEISLALAAEMKWRPGSSERGEVGRMMQGVRQLAADYMIPVTRKQEWQWVRRMVAGQADPEVIQGSLQKLALAKFPHLKDEINKGITPGQFFAPYRNAIAAELEINPESVDLNKGRYQQVTSFRDSKLAKVRPMTMSEATLLARRDKRWLRTDNARERINNVVGGVMGSAFGL